MRNASSPILPAAALRRAPLTAMAILLASTMTPVKSVAQANGPVVQVTVNDLPPYVFTPGSPPAQLAVAAALPVRLHWQMSPGPSGEPVAAIRYGWNIRNPQNDEEWEQSWCETCRSAPPRIFNSGAQRFFLEGRDRAGFITSAQLEITIIPVAIEAVTWSSVKTSFGR